MRFRRKHQTMVDGQYYYNILILYNILRMFKFETLLVNGAIIICRLYVHRTHELFKNKHHYLYR